MSAIDQNVFDQLVNFSVEVDRLLLDPTKRAAFKFFDQKLKRNLSELEKDDPHFMDRFRNAVIVRQTELMEMSEKRQKRRRYEQRLLEIDKQVSQIEEDIRPCRDRLRHHQVLCRASGEFRIPASELNQLKASVDAADAKIAHLKDQALQTPEP